MPAMVANFPFQYLIAEQRPHHRLAFVVGAAEDVARVEHRLLDAILRGAIPEDGERLHLLGDRAHGEAHAGGHDALHAIDLVLQHELAQALDRILRVGLFLDDQLDLAPGDATGRVDAVHGEQRSAQTAFADRADDARFRSNDPDLERAALGDGGKTEVGLCCCDRAGSAERFHYLSAVLVHGTPPGCVGLFQPAYVGAYSIERELLDHVEQSVGRLRRAFLVLAGDRARDVGMQLGRQRHVGGLLVVDVPEAPRQRMHQAHGAGGELVARRVDAQGVELAVGAHEGHVVVDLRGFLEEARELLEARAFLRCRAARGAARDKALQLAAHFEEPQLAFTLISETMMPRRGRITTSRSRASRCSASRIGVRPMPRCLESSASETAAPGASFSVTIISSRSA